MKPRSMLLGLVLGAGSGLALNLAARNTPWWEWSWLEWVTANIAAPIGQVFLRLLFMLVIPLLFSALVSGIAELDLKQLGRIGARTLGYTVAVSSIAVVIGLVLVNVLRPGAGAPEELRAAAHASTAQVTPTTSGKDVVIAMVPDNVVKAAASGDMIGVIVFALIFGVALALTPASQGTQRLREAMQGLYEVMMTAIGGVLRVAPIGVGALLFAMTVRLGTGPLKQLAAYVGVTILGLSLHMVVVYSVLLKAVGRTNPLRFFRDVRPAMITAFSTSSSSATLPTALKVAEEGLRRPPAVSRFVLTVGATMNQNGSALFEGVTVLFLAQLYGVELSLAQQGLIMGIAILSGIGAAGVPGSTLPVIAMILTMVGIPVEGMALILGVDRLLDMCRTTVNVVGDLVAVVCLSPREGSGDAPPSPEQPALSSR